MVSGLPSSYRRVSVRFRFPSDVAAAAAAAAAAADGDFGFGAGGALAESLYSSPWFSVPVSGGDVDLGWEVSVFLTLGQELEDIIANEAICFQVIIAQLGKITRFTTSPHGVQVRTGLHSGRLPATCNLRRSNVAGIQHDVVMTRERK
jgi:hypothetical protein